MLQLVSLNDEQTGMLYEEKMRRDFPPSELKRLSSILSMRNSGVYDVLGAYIGEVLVAYALLYKDASARVALLDYLAVDEAYRRRGIGSELLSMLRTYYALTSDVLLIECERPKTAPDEDGARSRIRFYTRAGAELTSVRIWLFDVEYSILVLPCKACAPDSRNWAEQMLGLYRQMLPADLYEKNVRLLRG